MQLQFYFRCMIDIYYPYHHQASVWNELRYSLRSLEANLLEEFRVWIVGDRPDWITGIHFIPQRRCEGMKENQTFDSITKLMLFCEHPLTNPFFIRMYDDMYLLESVTVQEIGKFKAMYDWQGVNHHNYDTWYQQLIRTMTAVMRKGYHGWNTETHFPELFNKELMLSIIGEYNALENRYLTSTLYHNTLFPDVQPEIFRKDFGIQFFNNQDSQFYTSSEGDLKFECAGKKYLAHNNGGLNDNLKAFLEQKFPTKSRFEI